MATPLSADRLVAALRAEGVKVVEHPGWRTHNRNHVGAWGPVSGVMIHHTVSSGTASSVELCFNGYEGLPGPLCQGVIAKDGTVHLIGNGRANHAGAGDPDVLAAVVAEDYGDRPPPTTMHQGSPGAVDGNSRFYGFECINLGNGADPWPATQLDAIERASAAICRAHGWSAKSVIGHLEWSDYKSDPRGFGMPGMRTRIATRLNKAPTTQPAPVPEEDDVPLTDAEMRKIAQYSKDEVWAASWKSPADPDGPVRSAATFLRWADIRHQRVMTQLAGLTASVEALAKLVGEDVDTEAVVAAVQAAIRDAVINVDVDINGAPSA